MRKKELELGGLPFLGRIAVAYLIIIWTGGGVGGGGGEFNLCAW